MPDTRLRFGEGWVQVIALVFLDELLKMLWNVNGCGLPPFSTSLEVLKRSLKMGAMKKREGHVMKIRNGKSDCQRYRISRETCFSI